MEIKKSFPYSDLEKDTFETPEPIIYDLEETPS